MDVSENSGFSPQIIHFNRVFPYKPSILGYPYFWKHPYPAMHLRILTEIEATLGVDAFDQAIRSKVRQEKVWKYCRMGGLVRQT